jgi:hypothetical protein
MLEHRNRERAGRRDALEVARTTDAAISDTPTTTGTPTKLLTEVSDRVPSEMRRVPPVSTEQ